MYLSIFHAIEKKKSKLLKNCTAGGRGQLQYWTRKCMCRAIFNKIGSLS